MAIPNLSFVQCRSKNGAPLNLPNAVCRPRIDFVPGFSFIECQSGLVFNSGTYAKHYLPQPFFGYNPVLWGEFLFGPGYVGEDYREQWFLENVTQPVFFQLDSGSLPPGLRLSTIGVTARGQIAGVPTTTGLYSFTLRAIGPRSNGTKDFSILISYATSGGGTAYVGGN
jgi:hypothetical protein